MPIVCIPPILKKHLFYYKNFFSKSQFNHFQRLVTGLIVSPNKTLQEINDSFGKRNQSNFNRFVTKSPWEKDTLKTLRLDHIKSSTNLDDYGIQIIDV